MGKSKKIKVDRKEVLRKHKVISSNKELVEVETIRDSLYDKHSEVRRKNQANRDKRRNKVYASEDTNVSSRGEAKIKMFLLEKGIRFYTEHTFEDLINPYTGAKLRFDFFLPDYKLCIEFDGAQHFRYVKKFHGDNKEKGSKKVAAQIVRDEIKNKFCKSYCINLLRINYKQYHKINSILINRLKPKLALIP